MKKYRNERLGYIATEENAKKIGVACNALKGTLDSVITKREYRITDRNNDYLFTFDPEFIEGSPDWKEIVEFKVGDKLFYEYTIIEDRNTTADRHKNVHISCVKDKNHHKFNWYTEAGIKEHFREEIAEIVLKDLKSEPKEVKEKEEFSEEEKAFLELIKKLPNFDKVFKKDGYHKYIEYLKKADFSWFYQSKRIPHPNDNKVISEEKMD